MPAAVIVEDSKGRQQRGAFGQNGAGREVGKTSSAEELFQTL